MRKGQSLDSDIADGVVRRQRLASVMLVRRTMAGQPLGVGDVGLNSGFSGGRDL